MSAARVRVVAGPDAGRELPLRLGQRLVVGRGVEADLRLADARVSRRHLALEHRLPGVVVEDLGSRDGVRVDGAPLPPGPRLLAAAGGELELGATRLRVERTLVEDDLPRLPGLRFVRRLGEGGSGTVYEAVLERTGARVAVKLLDPGACDITRRRFARERALAARLDHPGLARVLDLLDLDGRPCLVRELVDGPTLEERVLADGPLPAPAVTATGAALARALAHAHLHGVIHRDVKPANVVLDRAAGPKLIDLDLAKLRTSASRSLVLTRLTATGEGLGSLAYVAPEQLDGARDVDARADVYGLGLTLYHAATGRQPFLDVAPEDFFEALTARGPRPLAELAPTLPPRLREVLERAYALDPAARYADAAHLAAALAGCAGVA